MKPSLIALLAAVTAVSNLVAEPLLTSWYTESSGRYARIYPTLAEEAVGPGAAVATWERGRGVQVLPTYVGVSEIAFTATDIYVRSTGLGGHIMGPWYGNAAKTNLFPNYPANQAVVYRIPRAPGVVPTAKTLTGLGRIGLFVDGVSMFDTRDAFSYDTSAGQDERPGSGAGVSGDDVWNRDAYINEGVTFDSANAHQAGFQYHYHANPPGLRHLLGDSVDYDAGKNTYTENFNGGHSPILGWVRDGYPIYGPYGYSDPQDPGSEVVRMRCGFRKREITVRHTLPAYAARDQGFVAAGSAAEFTLAASRTGPDVTAGEGSQYELGHYLEDYEFLGDVGFVQGQDYDLDLHNGRFCVTPEFPEGTYAYFVSIEGDGTPKFPYNIGRSYYGRPVANAVANVAAGAVKVFEGGPEKVVDAGTAVVDPGSGDVTLTWSATEGGSYVVESSGDLEDWELRDGVLLEGGDEIEVVDAGAVGDVGTRFYRAGLVGLEGFDDRGFAVDNRVGPGGNNVLLIIVDDWGIDSSPIDTPGAERHAPMPKLEEIAAQGLRFTNAYAQAMCSPTRATMLTGRYAFRHTVGSPGGARLPEAEWTLPEVFAAAGSVYGLGAFGKWHLGGGATGPNVLGGWPTFAGTLQAGVADYWNWDKTVDGVTAPVTDRYATTEQVDDTLAFIDGQGDSPWFAWLAFNAPHTPFHTPDRELLPSGATGTTARDRFEMALEAMDTEIRRLLDSVDLETTNVILIGDNGTAGNVIQAPYDRAHSKGTLYEGGLRVPLVVMGPDVRASGTNADLVHCADIFATVAELGGIDLAAVLPAGMEVDSRSLYPALSGTGSVDGGVVLEAFGGGVDAPGRMIREGDYKLIIFDDPSSEADVARFEFYNVVDDPNEQRELLALGLEVQEQVAYDVLIARNEALGGNFGGATGGGGDEVTFYIELPNPATPNPPPLINNGGNAVHPRAVTIGGVAATWEAVDLPNGNPASRVDAAGNSSRFWVKVVFDPSGLASGSYPVVVEFRPTPMTGVERVYTAVNEFVVP